MEFLYRDNWGYVVSSELNGCIITKYTGNEININVPENINGYPTKGIGVGLIMKVMGNMRMSIGWQTTLERVFLPSCIEIIDDWAFFDCHNLREVVLPASLRIIGNGSFYKCAFTSINLPHGLIEIGNSAFQECSAARLFG